MTPLHMALTLIGAAYVTAQITRFIVWLDTPRGGRKGEPK